MAPSGAALSSIGAHVKRAARRLALVAVALAAFTRVRRWHAPISRYTVHGDSMEPTYHAGNRLLVNRLAYRRTAPAIGDVVVLRDPERAGRYLLKRVAAMPANEPPAGGAVYVLGDNHEGSRDSRHFGPVPRSAIIGRAWRRY